MNIPIVLFAYARPEHTWRTVDALLNNRKASEHDLIIYSDAPRSVDKQAQVQAVRDYLKTISGFRSVIIRHRPHNYGLAKSIIDGVTEVLEQYESIIVLEDDMITSPHFLAYMNDALVRFAEDSRIVSVHGYVYPVNQSLPEAFFLPGADCWGWGTWRRGWALFNPDGRFLLNELKRRNLLQSFDFNGAYDYSGMLESQIRGRNDSWAIRWYASAFLASKLTLYPGRSLVHNIGNDGSGTHCGSNSDHDVRLSKTPIDLTGGEVLTSDLARSAFEDFFRRTKGSWVTKVANRLKHTLSRVFA